jgi:hypothetical protein
VEDGDNVAENLAPGHRGAMGHEMPPADGRNRRLEPVQQRSRPQGRAVDDHHGLLIEMQPLRLTPSLYSLNESNLRAFQCHFNFLDILVLAAGIWSHLSESVTSIR